MTWPHFAHCLNVTRWIRPAEMAADRPDPSAKGEGYIACSAPLVGADGRHEVPAEKLKYIYSI